MQLFAANEEVAQLEAALPALDGYERTETLATLAWHLRQRSTPRALLLADEASRRLAGHGTEDVQLPARLSARLDCIRAEARRLYGELDAARTLAEQALAAFTQLADHAGCADSHLLLAVINGDDGQPEQRDAELEQAALSAHAAGDMVRAKVAETALARFSVFRDLRSAKERWNDNSGNLADVIDTLPPGLGAWVSDFLGVVAYQSSEFGTAVRHFIRTHHDALASGQISRAITAATNIGNSFTSLNDHHTALEWNQRGLALARPTGWPLSIAGCLMQTAETLRHLGRLDAASQLLREALDTLAPLAGSRDYAIATEYLGDVALDRGDHAEALRLFKQLGELAQTLHETEFLTASLRGQAHALSRLGRPEEALVAAAAALGLSRQEKDAYAEVATLKVLARIYGQAALPPPAGMTAGSAALHYLQQALAVAATIEGYIVPGDLLDAIAQEYAAAGDYEQAYGMMLRANAARVKTHSHEATNRAIALQVQHQTERERAEAEYQRRLAAAETRRSEVLMETNAALEAALKSLNDTKAQLEDASLTDSLTGLRNRRFLMQHIDSDVAMALRQYDEWMKEGAPSPAPGADLVFFMVDLDHFKSINDSHGHNAGDAVLVQVRQRLRQVFRDSDHIVRWGGEEFLVLARNTIREEAPLIAERVRAVISNTPFALPGDAELSATCSIGFAAFPLLRRHPRLLGWPQVIELADQCLYKAKRDGRNRWIGLAAPDEPADIEAFTRLAGDAEALVAQGYAKVTNSPTQGHAA